MNKYSSHGDGRFDTKDFHTIGNNVVFERGVLVFHPENISIGKNVYVGHNTILKGYYNETLNIGDNTWIGQGCFIHSAGRINIGNSVGVGPMVKILTSYHEDGDCNIPVINNPLIMEEVVIEDGADIGVGTIILPGVTIGQGCIVGAGAVVTNSIEPYSVAVGVPAKIIRKRK